MNGSCDKKSSSPTPKFLESPAVSLRFELMAKKSKIYFFAGVTRFKISEMPQR